MTAWYQVSFGYTAAGLFPFCLISFAAFSMLWEAFISQMPNESGLSTENGHLNEACELCWYPLRAR